MKHGTLRRLSSLLLAFVMAFSLAVPAVAAEEDLTVIGDPDPAEAMPMTVGDTQTLTAKAEGGLSDAPRALRNSVLLEIAVELIMPVMREELEADPEVRRDADLDFFAYLLSIGDALSIDYGGMTHAGDLNRLTYEYTEAIYSALKRR